MNLVSVNYPTVKLYKKVLVQCFPTCVPRHTSVPWKICTCAADFFEIHDIYTSFQPKLSKCYHEVIIDNVGDRVMLPGKLVISTK